MPKTLKIHAAATVAVTLPLQPSPALGASPPATGPFCNNAAQPANVPPFSKEEAGEVPFVVSMWRSFYAKSAFSNPGMGARSYENHSECKVTLP
ncbi:MAG: hypothetical protein Q8O81_12700 [Giesbergeria sp.]|nr:hypothetical protein [Giesbergeria sp.]